LERASYSCRKSSEKFHRRELLDESTLISLQRLCIGVSPETYAVN
jgi:hypothetical protein